MNSIIEKLTDKRILIFGYGREGKSTEEYIKSHVKYRSLGIFEGKKEDINEDDYDYIIKSPGIVMLEENPKYTSQTELFIDEFSAQTIGITGTKGKSTTSSMLAHVLNACGKNAILLGNIGKPCFDWIDDIDENTIVVFELSCHQLLHINKAPHIAVFLNLFEEHLDYYGTMDKYFGAKANIISHQNEDDFCFVGDNVPKIAHKSQMTVIASPKREYELSILGEHNKTNAEFVYEIAEMICGEVDITPKSSTTNTGLVDITYNIINAINAFAGLPHRLEYFATVDDVRYYDDSISTIPEACINAVKSVPNVGTVIVGGMDRGIDYDILVDFIRETKDVLFILCYATGQRIYSMLGFDYEDNSIYPKEFGNIMSTNYISNATEFYKYKENTPKNVMLTTNIDYAVELAKKNTEAGKACILSPAAPSYGYFKNFEERGEYFKSLVR